MTASMGASLHRCGMIANGIPLVMRTWLKDRNDMGAIFADSSTVFAHLKTLVNARDTEQCRKQLRLAANVDMAIICTLTAVHSHVSKGSTVTVWTCSDLQDTALKLAIYGSIPTELQQVGQGSVIAVLNPDMNELAKDYNYRSVSIKNCDNILLIGQVDGLALCKGVTTRGAACKNVVYTHNQGDFCKFHLKAAFAGAKGGKKTDRNNTAAAVESILKDVAGVLDKRLEDGQPGANFTFRPAEAASQAKVLSRLGGLGSLMHKVMVNRGEVAVPPSPRSANGQAAAAGQGSKPPKHRRKDESIDRTKEFEAAVEKLKPIAYNEHREYKQILGFVQLIAKYVNYIDKDAVRRSDIFKICGHLLDHPVEVIAIESLKLRRALRKLLATPVKDNATPTYVANSKRTEALKHTPNVAQRPQGADAQRQKGMKDLEIIMAAASQVDAFVEKENVENSKKRLVELERMDKAEEFKKTVKEIEVLASYCHNCAAWTEKPNPVCKQEGHSCSFKRCKKEFHKCLTPDCGFRYYSLNGHKPPLCPGCKQSTLVSEKTSVYNVRKDYLLPNEQLLDCEIGASRPLNADE